MPGSAVRIRVCMVCMGNICRSPVAAAVFEQRLADAGLADLVEVESAGTGGWHIGEPADPRAAQTLRVNGYDVGDHRARQFRSSWFDDFDLVLALDGANLADLRRIAPDERAKNKIRLLRSYDQAEADASDLDVPDPYYGDDSGFDHVLHLVEQAASGFIEQIQQELGVAVKTRGNQE